MLCVVCCVLSVVCCVCVVCCVLCVVCCVLCCVLCVLCVVRSVLFVAYCVYCVLCGWYVFFVLCVRAYVRVCVSMCAEVNACDCSTLSLTHSKPQICAQLLVI